MHLLIVRLGSKKLNLNYFGLYCYQDIMHKRILGSKIYVLSSNKIVQYNIKYKTKCVYQNDIYHFNNWHYTANQILAYWGIWPLIIGERTTPKIITELNGYNNYMITDSQLAFICGDSVSVKNLLTGAIKSNATRVNSFTLSQNEKHVLFHRYDLTSCVIPIGSFLKMDFENLNWVVDASGSYKLLWGSNKSVTPYLGNIRIINLESGTKKKIIARDYEIYLDDMMYVITKDVVIIVDSFFGVTEVRNEYDVFGYSTTYRVFVNEYHQLFRIVNGKFRRWIMRYDFWRDEGIPQVIHDVIETLIELDMFPSELIDEIYHQLILCVDVIATTWL